MGSQTALQEKSSTKIPNIEKTRNIASISNAEDSKAGFFLTDVS